MCKSLLAHLLLDLFLGIYCFFFKCLANRILRNFTFCFLVYRNITNFLCVDHGATPLLNNLTYWLILMTYLYSFIFHIYYTHIISEYHISFISSFPVLYHLFLFHAHSTGQDIHHYVQENRCWWKSLNHSQTWMKAFSISSLGVVFWCESLINGQINNVFYLLLFLSWIGFWILSNAASELR